MSDQHDGAAPRGWVLVVEDDPGTSRFLTRALERAGWAVEAVGDADAALAACTSRAWDALLVDIGLPGASGFDLVRQVHERGRGTPIALMTADASMDVAVRALRSEVDDFLAKPIDPTTLTEAVERLARRRGRDVPVERVLAVGAHPDDVEIGVGGILLAHRAAGDEVTVVTMSRGARGGDQQERAGEAARAAELLGAHLLLHDLDDTHISESNPTVALIEQAVAELDPTIVYTHTLHDLHQDHRNTHRATMVAARRVPSAYCYQSPSSTVEFHPARFVAIDPYMDAKVEVIGAYRSQVVVRSYLDTELVRATARYWGRFGDSRFCEPLEVVRERSRDRSRPGAMAVADGA